MKSLTAFLFLTLAACSAVPYDAGPSNRGSFALLAGRSNFGETDDDITMYGAELLLRVSESLQVEAGYQGGSESDADVTNGKADLDVDRMYLGLRVSDEAGSVHPFFSLGAESSKVDIDGFQNGFRVSDDDSAVGGYARLGFLLDVSDDAYTGLEVRAGGLGTDYKLLGSDVDGDYVQLAFLFGFRF